jgi:uncharacterized membrane protein
MAENVDSRPEGQLFQDLSLETVTLVRKEVELAKRETTEKLKNAGVDAATIAAGGALAQWLLVILAFLVIVVAGVIGLSQMSVTSWLSALIVGLLTIGVGHLLVSRGLANRRRTTVQTMKETARWTTEQRA